MAEITKKQKWRDLYCVHYDKTRTEGGVYTRNVKKRIDKEGQKINKFKDEVEFIDVKMQTAIRVSYDKDLSLDENLREYKEQKRLQDESD